MLYVLAQLCYLPSEISQQSFRSSKFSFKCVFTVYKEWNTKLAQNHCYYETGKFLILVRKYFFYLRSIHLARQLCWWVLAAPEAEKQNSFLPCKQKLVLSYRSHRLEEYIWNSHFDNVLQQHQPFWPDYKLLTWVSNYLCKYFIEPSSSINQCLTETGIQI